MPDLINVQQSLREAMLTDNTDRDRRLDVQVAAVVPQQFHQAVSSHTGTTVEELYGGLGHRHIAALLLTAGHKNQHVS